MELDWRIKRTFELIYSSSIDNKNISSIQLRGFYIRATDNQSKSSFSDFVERCIALDLLQLGPTPSNKITFNINQDIWDLIKDES